jgi:hypothetical protein
VVAPACCKVTEIVPGMAKFAFHFQTVLISDTFRKRFALNCGSHDFRLLETLELPGFLGNLHNDLHISTLSRNKANDFKRFT